MPEDTCAPRLGVFGQATSKPLAAGGPIWHAAPRTEGAGSMAEPNDSNKGSPSHQVLQAGLFVNQSTFPTHTVSASNELRPNLFVNQNTFPTHEVHVTPSAVANSAIAAVQAVAPPSSAKEATISAFKTIGNMGTPELAALQAQLADPPSLQLVDYGIGEEVSLASIGTLVTLVLEEQKRKEGAKDARVTARRAFLYGVATTLVTGVIGLGATMLAGKQK